MDGMNVAPILECLRSEEGTNRDSIWGILLFIHESLYRLQKSLMFGREIIFRLRRPRVGLLDYTAGPRGHEVEDQNSTYASGEPIAAIQILLGAAGDLKRMA